MMPARPGEISPRRFARELEMNEQTVWRWCREGKIEARRVTVSGRYWIRTSEINRVRKEREDLY